MATPLNDKMSALGAARRKKIEDRAAELIAEEMSLRDLRRARAKTQQHIAESLGIGQEGVSRIEKRSDLLISTLQSYVAAMGGKLRLIAEFPDRPPILLSRLAEIENGSSDTRKRNARSSRK
jgi:transcriptional regulator with XRE-family HTH domain